MENKCSRNRHTAEVLGLSGESKNIWQDNKYVCDNCKNKAYWQILKSQVQDHEEK